MSAEEWRPALGFPGYEVSDLGRVRSLKVWKGNPGPRMKATPVGNRGYRLASLALSGKQHRVPVHHLVMAAFVGPRPSGMEVRHLNGDRFDNRLVNLAYGTRSENEHDKVRHGAHHMARRTHCKNGHEFNDENSTTATDQGRPFRRCRACVRARYHAKKEAAA